MTRRSNFIQTFLCDQNTLGREGLAHILQGTRYRVVNSVEKPADLDDAAIARGGDMLLLVQFGETCEDEFRRLWRLKASNPSLKTVILADCFNRQHLGMTIMAGADGYLLKSITGEALLKSLELVFLGESVFSTGLLPAACRLEADQNSPPLDEHLDRLFAEPRMPPRDETPDEFEPRRLAMMPEPPIGGAVRPLSERERQILRCIVHGASNKHIARQFSITEATVKVHMKAILRKIRVRNRTQAAVWAMNNDMFVDSAAFAEESGPLVSPHLARAAHERAKGRADLKDAAAAGSA